MPVSPAPWPAATLRHFGELDAVIRHFVPKPLAPHKAGPAMEILLLGAAELLILKGPAHAAVDGANRLASADSKAVHFKPLINAVLRKIASEGEAVRASTGRAAPEHAGLAVGALAGAIWRRQCPRHRAGASARSAHWISV